MEIPIIGAVLARERGARVLEIRNVLSHYDESLDHTVVDRYERPSCENAFAEDAETLTHGSAYDLMVSISTFEHIGHDEVPRDEDKIRRTMLHLRGLLSPHGSLIFTAPIGCSAPLDRLVDGGKGFRERLCLRRVNAKNESIGADWSDVREARFHHAYPFANAIVIARVSAR